MEKFFLKECILNKKKRYLINIASDIIDRKLSLEFLLKHYSNFEKIKIMLLTKEQQQILPSLPNFKIYNHLNELVSIYRKQ